MPLKYGKLQDMNPVERKILTYLSQKETVAVSAISRELRVEEGQVLKCSEPNSFLSMKEYIRIVHPVGNPYFACITEEGRRALWPFSKRFWHYYFWTFVIPGLSMVASVIAAVTGIIALCRGSI